MKINEKHLFEKELVGCFKKGFYVHAKRSFVIKQIIVFKSSSVMQIFQNITNLSIRTPWHNIELIYRTYKLTVTKLFHGVYQSIVVCDMLYSSKSITATCILWSIQKKHSYISWQKVIFIYELKRIIQNTKRLLVSKIFRKVLESRETIF